MQRIQSPPTVTEPLHGEVATLHQLPSASLSQLAQPLKTWVGLSQVLSLHEVEHVQSSQAEQPTQ